MSFGLKLFSAKVSTAQLKIITETVSLSIAVWCVRHCWLPLACFYQSQGSSVWSFTEDPPEI
jgi:hypothetical protein